MKKDLLKLNKKNENYKIEFETNINDSLNNNSKSDFVVEGTTNLFNYPEYNDIEKAKEVTQKDIKIVEESRRSGDPAVLIASSDKAKTVLGWKPEYDDLGTIIKTAWEWHSTHPNGYSK